MRYGVGLRAGGLQVGVLQRGMTASVTVRTASELADALKRGVGEIVIEGRITGSPSVTLPEGVRLRGGELAFLAKGVRLTKDNTLYDVTITTTPYEVAVYNDTSVPDAGTFVFKNVTTVGQVYLVADGDTKRIRVEADGLHVKDADVRGRVEQPHGFGVDVLQGGLTLWNRQKDSGSSFTATLKDVSVGTEETPVRGSGVFVAGYGDREGRLAGGAFTADLIETGKVVTDGGIAPGTPDKISGGVFVVSGATVDKVLNAGEVTTHGQKRHGAGQLGLREGVGLQRRGEVDRALRDRVRQLRRHRHPGHASTSGHHGRRCPRVQPVRRVADVGVVPLNQDHRRRLRRHPGQQANGQPHRPPRRRHHRR
ncbi:hypothetical protein ACFUC1_05525 [Pedococcus sp. NPDC057267]|uniref:hypothetical protein n=1 Tax=Pedococcus sp. NPDC057267 TaxID=3346077 RepID=UPI00362DE2E3